MAARRAKFRSLAKEFSDCSSASKGGDLGVSVVGQSGHFPRIKNFMGMEDKGDRVGSPSKTLSVI